MVTVTRDEVLKIAKISCLKVDQHEIDNLIVQLQDVLSYVSSLQDVVKKYEFHAQSQPLRTVNIVRADTTNLFDVQLILDQAPEHEENYFVVPLIVKQP